MLKVVTSYWDRMKDNVKSMENWQIAGSIAAIGVVIGTASLLQKYRPKVHDNVPMLAMDKWSNINGHLNPLLASRKTEGKFHVFVYNEMKKLNFPSVSCLCRPPDIKILFVTNPIHIKYIFETHFDVTIKNKAQRDRFEELLGDGIFNVNGNQWRFHRKIGSRMFSIRNLKNYMFDTTLKNTLSTMNKLHELNDGKNTTDLNDILGRYTADVFCSIAFGQAINSVSTYPVPNPFGVAFDDMVEHVGRRAGDVFWKVKRMLNIGNEAIIHSNHLIIQQFCQDIIDKKHLYTQKMIDETGKDSYDLLSLFLKHDPNLSTKDLKDIAINFIIAGRDTTRMLLAWFLWQLTLKKNQNILNKLYKEVDDFVGKPNYDDFSKKFKYLEGCLCESLRLNPSVPVLGRGCIKDLQLPKIKGENQQYTIRKGDVILVPAYGMARNPKIWGDDCCEYKPERWTKGLSTFDQYKFAVFNWNPRLCLGKNFAIQEAKLFSYHFLKNFKFKLMDGHKVEFRGGAILNMNGLPLHLESRK